ncbi:MAG: hypothetical protein IPO22_02240 [Anaerolineales bacterium]|nr:hypothetical protein [Anaerolineales bacterium]
MTDQNAASTPKENTPAAAPAGTPVPRAGISLRYRDSLRRKGIHCCSGGTCCS